jgi:Flp pilus assembly protein TadD
MKNNPPSVYVWRALCASIVLSFFCSRVDAATAEIISIDGKGEFREAKQINWQPATVKQALVATQFLRTGDSSKIALLFADKTQMRIGANSMFQVEDPANNKDTRTTIDLKQGRAWMQTKPVTGAAVARTPTASEVTGAVVVRTPTALAAIRGTDWELRVDDDGKTTLTVLSGVVDFSNSLGRVDVGANEQAVAEKGRAPIKSSIINSAERIQWVSSFTIAPAQYRAMALPTERAAFERLAPALTAIADAKTAEAIKLLQVQIAASDSSLPSLLLADCYIYEGELGLASNALEAAQTRFLTDARVIAARSNLALRRGNISLARQILNTVERTKPSLELALANGEVARLEGDGKAARRAFNRASEVAPADARGWLGLGKIESERGNLGLARQHLSKAVALDAKSTDILAEMAGAEIAAANWQEANTVLQRALAIDAANPFVQSSNALLLLVQGMNEAALDALLKAAIVEPRHARTQLYLTVAYYRLGQFKAANEALARAMALDPNDPLPHLVASVIANNNWNVSEAVAAATQAMTRLPYLRSLNQFANNQRGTANLGGALASVGLDAWAQNLGVQSYLPLWAGSHLFMADRYAGDFARRSELLQGFVIDPLVFGAPNRYQSLLGTASQHARLSAQSATNKGARVDEGIATLNGTVSDPQLAYLAELIETRVTPKGDLIDGRARTLSTALGIKPAWNMAGFATFSRLDIEIDLGRAGVDGEYQRIRGLDDRAELGGNVGLDAFRQFWLKAGAGKQKSQLDTVSRTSNAIIPGLISQRETEFSLTKKTEDVQLHFIDQQEGRRHWRVGAEWARAKRPQQLAQDLFVHGPGASVPRRFLTAADRASSWQVAGTFVLPTPAIEIEGHLGYARHEQPRQFSILIPPPVNIATSVKDDLSRSNINAAIGAVWQQDQTSARATCGQWMRPVSSSSLLPVAVAGIVIDDQLTYAGGVNRRCALRAAQQWSSHTFVSIGWERQAIKNLFSALEGVVNTESDLSNPDRLRARAIPQIPRFEQLEERPVFQRGRVDRTAISVDQLLIQNLALRLNYVYSDTRNESEGLEGLRIAWLPTHQVNTALTMTWPSLGLFTVGPVYRSVRFRDEANLLRVPASWDVQARVFVEWSRKRWSLEAFVLNAAKKDVATTSGANLAYRF